MSVQINSALLEEFSYWGEIPAGTTYYDIADVIVDAITNQLTINSITGEIDPSGDLPLHETLVDALDQIRQDAGS